MTEKTEKFIVETNNEEKQPLLSPVPAGFNRYPVRVLITKPTADLALFGGQVGVGFGAEATNFANGFIADDLSTLSPTNKRFAVITNNEHGGNTGVYGTEGNVFGCRWFDATIEGTAEVYTTYFDVPI